MFAIGSGIVMLSNWLGYTLGCLHALSSLGTGWLAATQSSWLIQQWLQDLSHTNFWRSANASVQKYLLPTLTVYDQGKQASARILKLEFWNDINPAGYVKQN